MATLTDDELVAMIKSNPALAQKLSEKGTFDNYQTIRVDESKPGAGFMTRLASSFISDPLKKAKYIEGREGGSVRFLPDGQLAKMEGDSIARPVDPQGFDIGDIADFAGDIPEVGMGLGGAFLTGATGPLGAIAGAAAGGAAGDQMRQGVEALLTGSQGEVGEASDAALRSGLGEVGARGAGKMIKKLAQVSLGPHKNMMTNEAVDVAQNARKLGIDPEILPPDARSSSKLVKAGMQELRENPLTADVIDAEIDGPARKALQNALAELRVSAGGVTREQLGETALKSGIDESAMESGLTSAIGAGREAAETAINNAFAAFEKVSDMSAPANAKSVMAVAAQKMNDLQKLGGREGIEPELMSKFERLMGAADEVKTVGQLDEFRKAIGRVGFDRNLFGKDARRIYAAVMDDLETSFMNMATTPEQRRLMPSALADKAGSTQRDAFRKYLDIAKRNFELDEGKAVNRVFGSDKVPDSELIDNAVDKVFGVRSKKALADFKARINAVDDPILGPATEQGKQIFNIMKQRKLDQALDKATRGNEGLPSAATLYREFFSETGGLGEDVTTEIYGKDFTAKLRTFVDILRDEQLSRSLFGNFSNSGIRNEFNRMLSVPTSKMGVLEKILDYTSRQIGARAIKKPMTRKLLIEGMSPEFTQAASDALATPTGKALTVGARIPMRSAISPDKKPTMTQLLSRAQQERSRANQPAQ